MSLEITRHALLWCTLINWLLLAVWGLLVVFARDWLYRLWGRWYQTSLSVEQFDVINLAGLVFYKTAIILFNLVPCIALYLVG